MTSDTIINLLHLEPLPDEGGYYSQTWKTDAGTAIYFLLTQGKNGFAALHYLSGVEIYHFYAGDPVRLVFFPSKESPGKVREVILGGRLGMGEIPQCIVPAGTIQGSSLVDGGEWALLGTTMAPPYSQETFHLSTREELLIEFPEHRNLIMQLTRKEDS